MPDQIYLVITVRKPVADSTEGRSIYEWVKTKLAERPDVELAAHVTNHLDLDAPTPP